MHSLYAYQATYQLCMSCKTLAIISETNLETTVAPSLNALSQQTKNFVFTRAILMKNTRYSVEFLKNRITLPFYSIVLNLHVNFHRKIIFYSFTLFLQVKLGTTSAFSFSSCLILESFFSFLQWGIEKIGNLIVS